jgi:hypothetical protein
MRRIEHSVVIQCGPEKAFRLYTDYASWRHQGIFGDLRWVSGQPWQEGSRMAVEVTQPFKFTVTEVVVRHTPNEHVGFISHSMGVTIEHNVYFSSAPPGGTEIRVEIDVAGPIAFIFGFAVEPTLESITKSQFAALKQRCECEASAFAQ